MGHNRLISLNIGGNSTYVSHHVGGYERLAVPEVVGIWMLAPMMNINAVMNSGGVICQLTCWRF